MNQFAGISLKTRLYLLVLAAFIPVAILIVYVAEEQKTIEKSALLHKTKLLAQTAADAESLQVDATRDLMVAVTESSQLIYSQPQRMSGLLADLRDQTKGYEAFGIIDLKGRLVAGSNTTQMESDYSNHEWLRSTLAQNKLVMSPYRGERINGEPVLYFARPIFNGGRQAVAVAFAAINLNWMNRSIFRQLAELPRGSRLTLSDENQVLLQYEVDKAKWTVPQALAPQLQQRILDQSSGVLMDDDKQGISRIYAFAHLKSTLRKGRVSVVLEIPSAVALATSKGIFIRNLTLLTISALLAVLGIWWAADVFILRRVGAMISASRKLAAGDLQARIGPIGVRDELSHLAGVFDEMASSLQMRMEREEQVAASLKSSREQLRRLSAYQNDVREQERTRIAREIHDQLGQLLTILKMDLSWMKRRMTTGDSSMLTKMEGMFQVIEEALANLHAVTAELRPVILDDFGLVAAIEWQADMFQNRSGIKCRVENNGFEPDLPKNHATAIFRIFQEVLTNIIRHAQADDVVVHLEQYEGEFSMQVADNGRGITTDEINSPHAFGLLGIRERLYPVGGRVAFEGRPGQGTRVTIHLPMPKEGVKP